MSKRNQAHERAKHLKDSTSWTATDGDESTKNSDSLSKDDLEVAKSEGAEAPVPLTRKELFEGADSQTSEEPKKAETENSQATPAEPVVPATDDSGEEPPTPPEPKRHGLFGNGKMFLAGVGLLILAGCMFVFLWNHAKVTQAESIATSESYLRQIFTSPAHRDVKDSANNDQLDSLNHAVNQMAQSKEKDHLQKEHDIAADMVTARSGYVDLYDTHGRFSESVTVKDVQNNRKKLTDTQIYKDKSQPYFVNKYNQKFAYAKRVITHAWNRHRAVNKLYKANGKIKAKYASYDLTDLLLTLKYSKQSELEHSDRARLIATRKHLYKIEAQQRAAEASSAAAESALEAAQSSLLAAQQSSASASDSSDSNSSSSDSNSTSSSDSSSYSSISSTPITNAETSSSASTPSIGASESTTSGNNSSSSQRYSSRSTTSYNNRRSSSTQAGQ